MIRVRQIKIEVCSYNDNTLKASIAKKLKVNVSDIISYDIYKQSIDARDKGSIYYVFEVNVEINNEEKIVNKLNNNDIFISPSLDYKFEKTGDIKANNIVIVGTGPAGLFTAYQLSEEGYNVTVIERGKKIEERISDVNKFWETNELNENSNVQFGEGGAGTFSDGKLNTLIKDDNNRFRKVFNIFIDNGAQKEILYSYKPHIGTDVLRTVVKNMRERIINNGSKILYNTTLTNINLKDNKVVSIEVNNNEIIDCDLLVLAIGHSARDTFKMLNEVGLNMEPKPFAVGFRVIHPQSMIDVSQYGEKYSSILSPAPYKLTYKADSGRGVYSFCMCPGGYVVNSSSEKNKTCINGMSYSKRDSSTANSAIIITVKPEDYGYNLFDGIEFQRNIEKLTYELGEGLIPVQTFKDFKENKISTSIDKNYANFKGNYKLSNLRSILNDNINQDFINALSNFGRKIKGFDNDETIIAAIEARTSSPIRILRNDNFESNISNIYPCGEGAGYAGGITSSAIDGLKVAEIIAKNINK